MPGELHRRFGSRWPALADWFDAFSEVPEFRLAGERPIRIEETVENGTYQLKAELPGIDPGKDVEVSVTDGMLSIHAERSEEKHDKQRSEFQYGSFTRSVRLPSGADEHKITASYDKGVLTVRAPMAAERPSGRRIEITKPEG